MPGGRDPSATMITVSTIVKFAAKRGDKPEFIAHLMADPQTHPGAAGRPNGRKPTTEKKQTVFDKKRAAVLEAFESLGRDKLKALSQKEREAQVIANVSAKHKLSVTDRYVRDLWSTY